MVVVPVLLREVQALYLLNVRLHRALEGRRGTVVSAYVQVPHADNFGTDFDDDLLQQLCERAVIAPVNQLVEFAGNDRVFHFADVAFPGAGDLHEEVEGDLHGAVADVAADPLQVAVAVTFLGCLERDVLDQAPVDDRLVADRRAIIDVGSGMRLSGR